MGKAFTTPWAISQPAQAKPSAIPSPSPAPSQPQRPPVQPSQPPRPSHPPQSPESSEPSNPSNGILPTPRQRIKYTVYTEQEAGGEDSKWKNQQGQLKLQSRDESNPDRPSSAAVDPRVMAPGTIFQLKLPDGSKRTFVAHDTGTDVLSRRASGGKEPVIDLFESMKNSGLSPKEQKDQIGKLSDLYNKSTMEILHRPSPEQVAKTMHDIGINPKNDPGIWGTKEAADWYANNSHDSDAVRQSKLAYEQSVAKSQPPAAPKDQKMVAQVDPPEKKQSALPRLMADAPDMTDHGGEEAGIASPVY